MALARAHTWNAGDILKAADLNGEFNNILNNPVSLISPSTGAINFNLQAHTNLLPSAITATSGVQGQALLVSSSGTPAIWGGPPSGSQVKGLLGFISSQSGTFSADQYVMQTTNALQSWVVTATSSYSANVGTAGPTAGGRDQAGSFASTYVHWYAITTGVNSTAPAGLVSTNPPNVGPVALPTGYSGFTYLGGSVYTSASTTVAQDHRFRGNKAFYDGGPTVLNAGTATVETAVSLSTAMPPNALSYVLNTQANILSSAAATFAQISYPIRVVSGTNYASISLTVASLGGAGLIHATPSMVLPNVANQFFYLVSIVTGTSGSLSATLVEYEMPNGD